MDVRHRSEPLRHTSPWGPPTTSRQCPCGHPASEHDAKWLTKNTLYVCCQHLACDCYFRGNRTDDIWKVGWSAEIEARRPDLEEEARRAAEHQARQAELRQRQNAARRAEDQRRHAAEAAARAGPPKNRRRRAAEARDAHFNTLVAPVREPRLAEEARRSAEEARYALRERRSLRRKEVQDWSNPLGMCVCGHDTTKHWAGSEQCDRCDCDGVRFDFD